MHHVVRTRFQLLVLYWEMSKFSEHLQSIR